MQSLQLLHCTQYFSDSEKPKSPEAAKSPEDDKQNTSLNKMKNAILNMEKVAQTVKNESLSGNSSSQTLMYIHWLLKRRQ